MPKLKYYGCCFVGRKMIKYLTIYVNLISVLYTKYNPVKNNLAEQQHMSSHRKLSRMQGLALNFHQLFNRF